MVTNGGDTEGLFHGAFMESGAPKPTSDITDGQPFYDALVEQLGCTESEDTLECLRHAPYKELKAAMDASPGLSGYEVRDNAHGANGLRLTGAWTVAFTCVDAPRRWRLFDQ